MRRNNKKLIISLVAAGLVVVIGVSILSVALYRLDKKNRANEMVIENFYQESLYQMSESVSNIEINMSKLLVSTSDIETAVLLNDTYRHSQAAITALNNLPIPMSERRATDRFLNQLGDWCDVRSKEMLHSDSDKEIAVAADVFAGAFSDSTNSANSSDSANSSNSSKGESKSGKSEGLNSENSDKKSNSITGFEEQAEELFYRTARLNKAVKKAAEKSNGHLVLPALTEGIDKINMDVKGAKNSTEIPELIYDGPFSDGANQTNFKCIQHMDELSVDEAREKAEKTFSSLGLRDLKLLGEPTRPASYAFSGTTNSDELFVNVTKNGGYILMASMPCDNTGKTAKLDREAATEKAIEYAEMCGYEGLSPVWYTHAAGFAVVNLTPVKDGVVYYPDLVKIKVCLVNGDFKGVEATGYCACHAPRNFAAKVTKEQASRAVSKKLDIKGVRLAVVPKDMNEKLCYEFSAEYKGLDYFVYIDAENGKQFNIMRVIDSEQGQMVM